MDGALRLFLLAALTLLGYAQTFKNYNNLPDLYKTQIVKALRKANSNFGAGYHIAFHSLLNDPESIEGTLKVNVLLMVTTCKKASENAYEHRNECNKQKNKTPWIDCLVCIKNNNEELVDCGRMKDVKNKTWVTRNDCKKKPGKKHLTGGGTLLSQKSEDLNKQYGCLGCV